MLLLIRVEFFESSYVYTLVFRLDGRSLANLEAVTTAFDLERPRQQVRADVHPCRVVVVEGRNGFPGISLRSFWNRFFVFSTLGHNFVFLAKKNFAGLKRTSNPISNVTPRVCNRIAQWSRLPGMGQIVSFFPHNWIDYQGSLDRLHYTLPQIKKGIPRFQPRVLTFLKLGYFPVSL